MESYRPLEGLKVIELASVLAGPAVGMFFAELGAKVIKVENRSQGGDMTRSWKLESEDSSSPISAYFSSVNYAKILLDLDLNIALDRERLFDELKDTDILINNMKESALERFGLKGKDLQNRYPNLIISHLYGFAGSSSQVAFDVVMQAETGYISMCGSQSAPAKLPVAFIDLFAAHQLKEAILLALYQRTKDGRGALIESSLEEAALSSLANQASNHLMTGFVPSRMGTLHPNIAPYGEIVESSDGVSFVLAIGTDTHFERLCALLDLDLSQNPAFENNRSRISNRTSLHNALKKSVAQLEGEVFYARCLARKIPVGRIRSLDEVLASDAAQSMLKQENIEGVNTRRLSTVAFHVQRN